MAQNKFYTHKQSSPYKSERPLVERLLLPLWDWSWSLFCSWTPKPFNPWRLFWLRLFGCKLDGKPFVHQRAIIDAPWKLTMHDRSCLGDRAHAYCLDEIELGARSTVAQEAYLCTGTHDFEHPNLPLVTAKIKIGEDAYLGARAFVMPGVTVGAGAVIGACSLVTDDMPDWTICFGHPCKPIKPRVIRQQATDS